MPLLKKKPFQRRDPPPGLNPEDEVFYCEATKEVFRDYESFFQRTILCNSLVWSCSVTGKSNLTYEEAVESEKKARKRLGDIPKPLKRALLWTADHTRRGRLADLVDDVYIFTSVRYFVGEIVEGIIDDPNGQPRWCDCKVLKVIPPTQEEIDKDAEDEKEEEEKSGSPSKKKAKKSFFPPEHLFKYELLEEDPDNPDDNPVRVIEADDIRRDKGTYTREKNLLFLKNLVDLEDSNENLRVKESVRTRYKLDELKFTDFFAGPEPVFEVTKRAKGGKKGGMGTLDGWVSKSAEKPKMKKAEIEAEMKRMKEQNERFKEEMKQRAEEAKKRKIEEKAKEKERKKEERRLVTELLNEWKKPRDDLECDDLKELPEFASVQCRIPNNLFGDFLSLLEFFHGFSGVLETKDTFNEGVTFKLLESALVGNDVKDLFEVIRFMLQALFDLQQEEDEEVKLDAKNLANVNVYDLDKNILGKDEEIANQIRSATTMARWCIKHQGQSIKDLHMDEYSISEILRLHLESSGAFRSDKSLLWLYQQRGGYRLSDDPGLQFRMEETQILESLTTKTIFELGIDEKIKILLCLMNQVLSFATVRDEIDEKFNELCEAKAELRSHQINENKRQKAFEEAEKVKRREERIQKKEDDLKDKKKPLNPDDAHLTDRQKEAIVAQKEKEEKDRQKKEDRKKSEAMAKEKELLTKIAELQVKTGPVCLGRDRAYRRFWILESLPGLFIEHDDDTVGVCLPNPTVINPNSKPIDEATALERVKEILDKKSPEGQGSDKENDQDEHKKDLKTYSKKPPQQKVLSTKNGSIQLTSSDEPSSSTTVNGEAEAEIKVEPEAEAGSGLVDKKPNMMWGLCLADMDNCTVHSTILPKTHWSQINSIDEVDALIEALNPRGIREGELREKLIHEREAIVKNLKKVENCVVKNEAKPFIADTKADINAMVDLALRDQILEIEERIFFGTLGSLKIRDRAAWQSALQNGGYDQQCDGLAWGGKSMLNTPFESNMVSAAASRDASRPGTPNPDSNRDSGGSFVKRQSQKIRGLASAILQVAQMADLKYFKPPLGEDEKEKKKRLKEEEKRKKEADENAEIQEIPTAAKETILTPLQEWENSLMSSTSYAQLFIHLTTLDSSIIWSKSIMNAKCRICRRKGDPDKMLLCDSCDRGHHMYCLKPKLKVIPQGDWYCHDCKPKERVKTPKKKSRQVFSNDEEEATNAAADDDDEDDTQSEEDDPVDEARNSSDENNSEDEEKAETPPRRTKKSKRSIDPPKKAKKATGKKGGLSQLLGKRKSAAEASERIARVTQAETASGNSSGSESKDSNATTVDIPGERQSTRIRAARTSKSNFKADMVYEEPTKKKSKESRLSAESGLSNARNKRRRAVDEELLTMYNPSALEDLLNSMMKHKDGWPFDRPITKADAPDYFDIITRPMDLGTVRTALLCMKYNCNQEVVADIKQVFENCWTYNREDAEEYQCAVRLEKYFIKEAKKLGIINDNYEASAPSNRKGNSSNEETDSVEENLPLAKKARKTL